MKIKDKRLFELLKEYLTIYLPLQKNYSVHTIKSYKGILNILLDFICFKYNLLLKDISLNDFSYESINAFMLWLENERSCKSATVNHHLYAVLSFLKYVGMKDPSYNDYYLSANRVSKRKTLKKLTVNHFSETALAEILRNPNTKKFSGHRDLFYMILLYDTGARNREILDLRYRDVATDKNFPYIILHGKGKKIRSVPIMKETLDHFHGYCSRFHPEPNGSDFLFFTVIHNKHCQMSDDNVARFIKKYAKQAKQECDEVPDRVTPHMFRHSRALHLYRKGLPLPLISEWLGHANIETTLIYAYADTEMKRAAIEKATDANHPIRHNNINSNLELNNETIKKLYGLN